MSVGGMEEEAKKEALVLCIRPLLRVSRSPATSDNLPRRKSESEKAHLGQLQLLKVGQKTECQSTDAQLASLIVGGRRMYI